MTTNKPVAPLEAACYLILGRDRFGMQIVDMRKNRPAMRPGQVAVRVRLQMDAKAFEQMIPTVVVELGVGDLIEPKVQVLPAPEDEEVGL